MIHEGCHSVTAERALLCMIMVYCAFATAFVCKHVTGHAIQYPKNGSLYPRLKRPLRSSCFETNKGFRASAVLLGLFLQLLLLALCWPPCLSTGVFGSGFVFCCPPNWGHT